MPNITFRGAYVRFADLRIKESGTFVRIHFTADLSEPVSEAMEWGELPECAQQTQLIGELVGNNMMLTPNGRDLKQHAIEMECTEVNDFSVFRIKGDAEGSVVTELRFTAIVVEIGAVAKVENYLRTIGQQPGTLKVGYIQQMALEEATQVSDEHLLQVVLAEND